MIKTIIEYFIPAGYDETEESWRRARLAVIVYMLVGVFSLCYTALNLVIGFWGGLFSQAPLFITSLICLFLYRKRVEPFIVASIFFSMAVISISTAIFFSGGFSSFIIPWLATTPIVALLVSGKRMGRYTLIAQLAMLIIFYIFAIYGISATGKYTTDIPPAFILSCYIGLILLFYAVAIVFENGKSYAMGMLSGKNEELQQVINKLKSTQQQLVQQEKLASLGQLTAGIAHEIKNPLNFVNNFSDVSIELIEEARKELGGGTAKDKYERAKPPFKERTEIPTSDGFQGRGINEKANKAAIDNTLSIFDDIEFNLRKIHEHGSRADRIVKSMLQHSRKGSGIMEPTHLNALLKEYSNLAFHGMRAGNHPINIDIELELDENIGEVPLIAEDFSRVILNLCNNAFDAMRGKQLSQQQSGDQPSTYEPKLTIRTNRENDQIIVEIKDNGPGIPVEIQDKIMQPFFTTKKGTEGTGLGLYITNDIVKAHGGRLEVTNDHYEGTCFTIKLTQGG